MMTFADANDKACVSEGGAVAAGDEMICLKNKLAVVGVSVALGDAVVVEVTKEASAVTGDHDLAGHILDFTLDCRGV